MTSWQRAVSLVALVLGSTYVGCSQQGEGERCSFAGNSDDCGSGLACTKGADLAIAINADLCCPPEGVQDRIPECALKAGGQQRVPTGGAAGAAGGAGAPAAGSAGATVTGGGAAGKSGASGNAASGSSGKGGSSGKSGASGSSGKGGAGGSSGK